MGRLATAGGVFRQLAEFSQANLAANYVSCSTRRFDAQVDRKLTDVDDARKISCNS